MPAGRHPNSLAALIPNTPGEIRNNPEGRKRRRHATYDAVMKAADKMAGDNWTDPDYYIGRSTARALCNWIEESEKNQAAFWTKIFPKTIVPPNEESGNIDFADTEVAISAIMAQYIADPGFFRKVMDKALGSEKLRPVLMDITAQLHVFAVPAEAKEIIYEGTFVDNVAVSDDGVSADPEPVRGKETPDTEPVE